MRRFAPVVVALALAGCSSEPAKAAPRDYPTAFRKLADEAAASLEKTERFKSDVLDLRGVLNRTAWRDLLTGDLESAFREALARHGFHVLARTDPKPSDRAAFAVQIYGLVDTVDGDWETGRCIYHFEAAVESPTSAGPARVVWSFQDEHAVSVIPPEPPHDPLHPSGKIGDVAIAAQKEFAAHLQKDDAVQVIPVADRTSRFPVLVLDACLRHELVAGGIPVVWRRAAGVDAPIGMGAASSPEKRVDLPSINGEVTDAPGGGAILTLKLERVNPATKKLEVVAQFDRKLP
jgi:hypothetical protein